MPFIVYIPEALQSLRTADKILLMKVVANSKFAVDDTAEGLTPSNIYDSSSEVSLARASGSI